MKKKLYSTFLLGLYILLIGSHSVHHDVLHSIHEDSREVNHGLHLDEGLIHFLGHLIHSIQEIHDPVGEHHICLVSPNVSPKVSVHHDDIDVVGIVPIIDLRLHPQFEYPSSTTVIPRISLLRNYNALRAPPTLS